MRTVFEIVEDAKAGGKPTHDECYFAMLALSALLGMEHRELREVCQEGCSQFRRNLTMNSSFERYKRFLDADPQEWLGPNHTPGTPENNRLRKAAFAVLKKVTGETVA